MILKDTEVIDRMNSPLNLINKMRNISSGKRNAMDLFIPRVVPNENDEPLAVIHDSPNTAEDEAINSVVDEKKLKMGLIKAKALDVIHDSLTELHIRLPEVSRALDYSMIAKNVHSILSEDGNGSKIQQQIVIYKPVINDINKYDTLVVME